MLFTSPTFLFVFLPVFLTVYWCCPGARWRNRWLLASSLAFYAWGQGAWVGLLGLSFCSAYALGLWIERRNERAPGTRALAPAVLIVLAPLLVTKYTPAVLAAGRSLAHAVGLPSPGVPVWSGPAGVSFFTFMALTYIVSVRRREARAQRRLGTLALYASLFPIVTAGPILRYRDGVGQLGERSLEGADVAEGVRRFAAGLAKKVLIANTLAGPADVIFALPHFNLSAGVAWFGLGCYTLQVYFDFSGYTDMAIGLGRMLGFRLPENFDRPYSACSVREFWTRWHISLSTWFRDYVFIPLAYPAARLLERRAPSRLPIDFSAYVAATLVTMLLIGLWHGATWSFAAWGLYHGVLLVGERTRAGRRLRRLPRPFQHAYLLAAVMIGWVVFRADTLGHAARFAAVMAGLAGGGGAPIGRYAGGDVLLAAGCAILLSTTLVPAAGARLRERVERSGAAVRCLFAAGEAALLAGILVASLSWVSAETFTPFIYSQF